MASAEPRCITDVFEFLQAGVIRAGGTRREAIAHELQGEYVGEVPTD